MRILRPMCSSLEDAIQSVDAPFDEEQDRVCDESCSRFQEGGPPCFCYGKEGDTTEPGW